MTSNEAIIRVQAIAILVIIIVMAIIGGVAWYYRTLLAPTPTTTPTPSPTITPTPTPSGPLAPDFSITDLNGNSFRLSDFRGKLVVIDFMATWCGPCRKEMLQLKVIWEEYGGKIVLMSIDIDPEESEEVLSAFAKEFPYATWIWARDTANLGQVYEVSTIPKMVIIDQDGYIRFTHKGETDASTLIQEIDQLLS